ncbi:hypothetical protein SJ414_000559 [Escherichia coli]|uniref:hypothetical protein n=1 Tax=Escherichia coli TaxID=562 RepID=UPI000BDFA64D|nr:hypothetical protein [Escherichia coli]ELX6117460.1 hypothetical protein [Escherichia coli]HAW0667516.1 hypothetical protein [Escherichia coli]
MNLYIIQNDTHFKNFIELATEGDFFIDLARFTGQGINYELFYKKGVSEINLGLHDANFYLFSSYQKIKFCFNFEMIVKKIISAYRFEKIITGNDGALQKIIIKQALKNNSKGRVEMWLDGLISLNKNRVINSAKVFMSYIADKIGLSSYVPSVIGTSSYVDTLYVMDQSVIKEYNFLMIKPKVKKIEKRLFPRHKKLISLAHNHERRAQVCKVLYLTSAWSFHGHNKCQNIQYHQILNLLSNFEGNKDIDFQIRIHPRDIITNYSEIPVGVISRVKSFEEDILSASIIISARSTGLFEADMIGKKVIVYDEGFEGDFMNEYFDTLPRCVDLNEINSFISQQG